jgi:putative DNA primase/helicase
MVSEETVKAALDGAQTPDAAALLRSEVERLAKLDRAGYLVDRKQIASRHKIPAAELDKLIDAAHPPAPTAQRESLAPPAPEPHPEPVEISPLLDHLCGFIKRFVVLDKHALVAVVLWIAFTHCFEIAETSPRLRIKSPDKRCGKTRLLELLGFLIPHSITASNMSPSAIFRTIDVEHCPLFIDEADTFVRHNEEIRGLLNSGHTRASAFVIRSIPVGDRAWQQKRFSTWCPMAIAGIGKLPDTIEDRSITLVMRRKLRGDKVERLTRRNKSARERAATLASKLARFAADNLDKLREAEPPISDALNDRAADNWEHLLAIADLAGSDWPKSALSAALALSGEREDADEDSLRTRLLSDIRRLLNADPQDEISSADLCKALVGIETAPWSELNRGKPMTPARLSRMLKDFEIYVGKVHRGNARGYRKSDFEDAFERYLSSTPPDQSVQVSETLGGEGECILTEVSDADTFKSEETPTERSTSDTLTLSNPRIDSKHENAPLVERERFEL